MSCIFAIKGWYYSITHFTIDNMLIHLVFRFISCLFPLFVNTSHKLWYLRNFLGEWKKNPYKACKRASNWATNVSIDKTNTTKFDGWTKQCIPIINGATFSFICLVRLALALWNTLLSWQPIEFSLAPNSLALKLPNVTMAMNIKWKMFSIVPYTPTFSR